MTASMTYNKSIDLDYSGKPTKRGVLYGRNDVLQDAVWVVQLDRSIALEGPIGFAVNTKHWLKTILAFPLASAVCFVASYVVARILLSLNDGFGSGDMSAFLYWTLLFAASLLLPSLLFAVLLRNARKINRVWLGILVGSLAGFGWTFLNLWFLGPWFGAWSFNVLYCWILGGAFGILAVALMGQQQKRTLP